MKPARPLILAALTLAGMALPATSVAATEEQRARWVGSQPTVSSHGRQADPKTVCFGGGFFRSDDGSTGIVEGSPCPDIGAPLPVHRNARVLVGTPRAARSVSIAPDRSGEDPRPPVAPRRCRRDEPGRWTCRIPAPERSLYAILDIDYPGAEATWSFQIEAHSRERHR